MGMADNSFVRIMTALLKHQVKKLVGDDTLGAIGEELAAIGGDKLDEQVKSWLGEQTTVEALEKAAISAQNSFHDNVGDRDLELWMQELPLGTLPKVVEALEALPNSPDESQLESALRESITLNWKKLSPEKVNQAVNTFMLSLHSALLPLEKQTLMVIGRSVLRIEEKVSLLLTLFEKYVVTDKSATKNVDLNLKIIKKEYDEEIIGNTLIKEGKFVQIVISQMFRMADLLTSPEDVKAKKLYEIATDGEKCRRFLNLDRNGKKKKIPIEPYGYLTPVAVINDHVESLWRYAKKDFREGDDPLRFFPVELDLTKHLQKLGSIRHAIFDGKREKNKSVQNLQLSGGMRIYPPGTGIVRFSLTIEFRQGIELETVATLARKIDSLLFVNPDGNELDCPTVFMEIVDNVAQNILKKERYEGKELRWQPPETTFCFRDYKSTVIADKIKDFARLMSYAPENYEKLGLLQKRLERAMQNVQWQKSRLLFVVGQGVVLLLAGETNRRTPYELKNLFDRLIDTRELISAAEYAEKAFAERVSEEYSAYKMHKKIDVENLYKLVFTMQRVLYATYAIRGHLKNTGRGELMSFAQDLWAHGNPVDYKEFKRELSAILDLITTQKIGTGVGLRAEEIKTAINQILELPHPFPVRKDSKHFG
jgi:hypothetical protein